MTLHMNHHFHLVTYSPWPLTGSIGMMVMLVGLVKIFHLNMPSLFFIGVLIILMTMYLWWRDICREGAFQGAHTYQVVIGLKWGMILFIISEIFFFFSFFWTFFYCSLSPSIELGLMCPPIGIYSFNPFMIPLLNTIILLTSGISITWAHHNLINNNFNQSSQGLMLTIILGIYFTILQGVEYLEASFSISDSFYGAIFFMATGFHGIHVMIGTLFLFICLIRHLNNHFSLNHHFGFEAAAWYWHFVDIVWLFLYIFMYVWSN